MYNNFLAIIFLIAVSCTHSQPTRTIASATNEDYETFIVEELHANLPYKYYVIFNQTPENLHKLVNRNKLDKAPYFVTPDILTASEEVTKPYFFGLRAFGKSHIELLNEEEIRINTNPESQELQRSEFLESLEFILPALDLSYPKDPVSVVNYKIPYNSSQYPILQNLTRTTEDTSLLILTSSLKVTDTQLIQDWRIRQGLTKLEQSTNNANFHVPQWVPMKIYYFASSPSETINKIVAFLQEREKALSDEDRRINGLKDISKASYDLMKSQHKWVKGELERIRRKLKNIPSF